MIEYLKKMYSTPTVMWTAGQEAVNFVIILCSLAIIFGLVIGIAMIVMSIKEAINRHRIRKEYKEKKEKEDD